MDQMAIIALTVPVTLPVVEALGFDPIWFGVIVILLAEIGLITPPLGLNAFVVSRAANQSRNRFHGLSSLHYCNAHRHDPDIRVPRSVIVSDHKCEIEEISSELRSFSTKFGQNRSFSVYPARLGRFEGSRIGHCHNGAVCREDPYRSWCHGDKGRATGRGHGPSAWSTDLVGYPETACYR